ncbi:hypothetical protein KUTeg_012375 [Tegillarca granosa]|uniref:Calpain-5 n=1 Tax=Tegillarca granosa TaxID=220873 RepID=A0ABQ9F2X1_TEGGR|nr:hypothetical protein KUTeg_012375 [Tegillarca granosa]
MYMLEGASSGDVTQGRIGNCWFVAASSCLAANKQVWHNVIPDVSEQEWDDNKPENYQGIFHFRFWRYGEWLDVVIDDMLPTVNDELIFIHSQSKNEFWSALLEKAYAKLFGCYEALDGGDLGEALEDFTGGVSDHIDLVKSEVADKPEEKVELFARMQKEIDRSSLMAASIPPSSSDEMEAVTESGLVKGHAYGITAVKNVHLEGSGLFNMFNREKIPMIRLRNPWGKCEWKGAFSDGSPEWEKISKSDREKIGLTFEDDGEFWMTFDDFCKHFVNAAICRVVNTSLFSLSKTYDEGLAHGAWKKPERAGGCLNNKDTFLKNPQFAFDITDDEDEPMFHLLQKTGRTESGSLNQTIGFTIIRVEENRRHRIHDLSLFEVVKSTVFRDSRSIILNHDKPTKSFLNCCAGDPVLVTRVKIIKAEGLERQDRTGADPYCIVSCEGEKVYTPVCKDTTNPSWESAAIFFRKKPVSKPLKIQIWNSNVLRDQYMGKHVFMSTDEMRDSMKAVDLYGRKGESNQVRPGKLYIQITQSRNLTSI